MRKISSILLVVGIAAIAVSFETRAMPPTEPFLRVETGQHTGAINRILHLTGNGRVLTVSDDQTARVWDLNDGRLIETIRGAAGPQDEGSLFAAAANSRFIAVAGRTGWDWAGNRTHVRILDANSLTPRGVLSGLTAPVGALEFSPNGKYLAAGLLGPGSGVRIFKLGQGEPALVDKDFENGLTDIAYMQDGRLVAIDGSGSITIYPNVPNTGDARRFNLRPGFKPWRLAISPNGLHVGVGARNGPQIGLISTKTGTVQELTLDGSLNGALPVVSWSADSSQIMAAGRTSPAGTPENIHSWDVASGRYLGKREVGFGTVTALASTPVDGVVFGMSSGEWGLLGSNGSTRHQIGSNKPNFEAIRQKPLAISHDGSIIAFPIDAQGNRQARFNLYERELHLISQKSATLAVRKQSSADLSVHVEPSGNVLSIDGGQIKLQPNERVLDTSVSETGLYAAVGTNFYLRFYRGSKSLWRKPVPAPVWGVAISTDQRYLIAALGNGMIQWFKQSDGALALSLFASSDLQRWVVWTPTGHFDYSQEIDGRNGASMVGFHINQGYQEPARFIEIDRLYRKYYRREQVMAAFRGETIDARILDSPEEQNHSASETIQKQSPPILLIEEICGVNEFQEVSGCNAFGTLAASTRSNLSIVPLPQDATDAVEFIVQVNDTGGGVGHIEVRRNGVKVHADIVQELTQDKQSSSRLRTPLVSGENRFEVTVFEANNQVSSQIVRFQVQTQERHRAEPSQVYVVAVGIDDYKLDIMDLQKGIAGNDARAIADRFKRSAAPDRLFEKVHTTVLLNSEATKPNIKNALVNVAKQAKPNDIVIVFFSGHGEVVDGKYHYATYEMGENSRNAFGEAMKGQRFAEKTIRDVYRREGLSQVELVDALSRMQARQVVIMLDTCYAGSFSVLGLQQRQDFSSSAMKRVVRDSGRYLLASARGLANDSDGKDYPPGFGNGLFTSHALDGLDGKADVDQDRKVSLAELGGYVKRSVKNASLDWEIPQIPVVGYQGDPYFPILDIVTKP